MHLAMDEALQSKAESETKQAEILSGLEQIEVACAITKRQESLGTEECPFGGEAEVCNKYRYDSNMQKVSMGDKNKEDKSSHEEVIFENKKGLLYKNELVFYLK